MANLPVGTSMEAYSRFIYRDPATDEQIWVQFGDTEDPDLNSPNRVMVRRHDEFTWELETTTQFARVLREIGRVKGRMQRDTLGFVAMPFRATMRVQN
jgi:hypothetical protein